MTDFADWIDAIVVGAVSSDSTDWSRQITVITGGLPNDFPDWVEATSVSGAGPSSAIQFVDGTSNQITTAATSITVNAPSPTVAGDLLVAFLCNDNTAGIATVTSTGWTQQYHFNNGTGFVGQTYVLTKVAGASEPSTYTFSSSSARWAVVVTQWSNTTALDGTPASTYQQTGTTIPFPSLTPTVAGDMLVGWFGNVDGNPGWWFNPQSTLNGPFTKVNSFLDLGVWYLPLSSAAATGVKNGLASSTGTLLANTLLLHA